MSNVEEVVDQIIGLNLTEASKIVRDNGFVFRVIYKDGSPLVVLRDHNTMRINVKVVNNEVVEFVKLG